MTRRLLTILTGTLLTLLFGLTTATGQPSAAQEAEQERIALAWAEAFNSGDVATMGRFRTTHMTDVDVEGWQARFTEARSRLGRIEVYAAMFDDTLVLGFESEHQGRVRFRFVFDDKQPNRLARIEPFERGGDGVPPPTLAANDWDGRSRELDAWLRDLSAQDHFSGSVLVVDNGTVRFEGAYGLANRSFGVANTLDTRFDVGSFNKDFTRLAILQLMVQGKLALDDTVGAHLPDYPNEEVRRTVTVRQLLDHTSGLGDYFTEEWHATPMQQLREIDDYLPIWGPKPLLSPPGTRQHYSNFGYTVLGAIVEARSGLSYSDYVTEHIFVPAGMTRACFCETDRPEPDVAVGYTYMVPGGRKGDVLRTNVYLEPVKGGPWGKAFMPIGDLYRFFDAMFRNTLLPAEHNWLTKADGWSDAGAALAGGGPGLSAMLRIEEGLMVIAMANLDMPSAEAVADAAWEAVQAVR